MEREKVLTVRNLSITFTTTAGPVHAIRGIWTYTGVKRLP